MDILKIVKGVFFHNVEGSYPTGTAQTAIDVKSSPVVVCGAKSTIGGVEIHAIDSYPDDKGINSLDVINHGLARGSGRQTLVHYYSAISTGAVPASIQLLTPSAGKTLYITSIMESPGAAGGTFGPLSDGIADGGTEKISMTVLVNTPILWNCGGAPMKFVNGVRWDAADQGANQAHKVTITGWEE